MPSIINGLFAGRAGISSHGIAIATVGDNISNSSTVGYKTTRAEFEDLLAGGQTIGKVVGSGSNIKRITTIQEQGTFEFTGRPLDLSIDGDGFFVVRDENSLNQFYTRAGNFRVNDEGNIVTQSDQVVLGFPPSGSGSLQALNINTITQGQIQTNTVTLSGNLDSTSAVQASPGGTDFDAIQGAAAFSTTTSVFDPQGAKHEIRYYFFKTAANAWSVEAYVDAGEVGGTAGNAQLVDTFALTFNADGSRATAAPTPPAGDLTMSLAWANGSTPPNQAIAVNLPSFTQFATQSAIDAITGDGNGVGAVSSVSVNSNGDVFAILDNGQTATLGVVALATFANSEGMSRVGGSRFEETIESGPPIIGVPGRSSGSIEGGNLELSTTDLANEFVKLITLQRGFQASSRIISQIDQLLNEIIQLA